MIALQRADREPVRGRPMPSLVQSPSPNPSILVAGRSYQVAKGAIVGRAHFGCPLEACRRMGFWGSPEVAIYDNQRFIGKHHARIQLDAAGVCWIQDLNSLNGTAILRTSRTGSLPTFVFEQLDPGRGYMLASGDIVALAFNANRGPYVTFSYHS